MKKLSRFLENTYGNISGLEFFLTYVIFGYIIYPTYVYLTEDVSLVPAFLFYSIIMIAAFYRLKRLKFSSIFFIIFLISYIYTSFYYYDFQNGKYYLENPPDLPTIIAGIVQLLFQFPVNLAMIFKNAKRKKNFPKESLSPHSKTNKINTKQIDNSSSKKSNADDDVVSKLERLAALKEKGILNDEEFQIQKNKILNS